MNLSDIPVILSTGSPTLLSADASVTVTDTTCPYCGVGCGVRATRHADGSVEVAGDTSHGSNQGRLCVKGSALAETVGLEGRLLHPQVRGADGTLQPVSWDHALDKVAHGFKDIIAEHGLGMPREPKPVASTESAK